MSASNAFETALLELIFKNTTLATIGDATGLVGSTAAGSLYVALHTGDPGEAGNQSTSECSFTSYARVAVARTGSAWTVSDDTVSNAAAVEFPENTGTSQTATHFSIGAESTGATLMLVSGALDSSLEITNGVTASFAIGELTATVG